MTNQSPCLLFQASEGAGSNCKLCHSCWQCQYGEQFFSYFGNLDKKVSYMFFSFYMINAILPKSIFIWLPQGITIHSDRDQNTNFHEYFPPNMTYSTSTPQSDAWYYLFVQNLRRHSFNEQSFSNNKRWRRFWINFEDLIFLGISNFQSQVGAITRETGGRLQGRRGTLGEGGRAQKC